MNAHEHVGQLYMENQRLLGEYGKLLDLLGNVCEGVVPPEQVRVDRDKLTWAIVIDAGKQASEEEAIE